MNIDNTLNIKSKIISIQKREKIDSIPGAYYDLYKTDYTFRETISKSSYSIPFHLIEHRLNPVNLDTIFKRTITSSPWKEGKKYRITVEGTIPEDLYYNQQINENTITKREVDLFCNSNNKIIAFEIANITIKGDTFKLSEALHNSGVWQNKGCFKNGEHYYTHGAEYERLTPYNKTYIMPMTRNYYNGSPWLKKESKIEKYDYTKKELRKIEKKEKKKLRKSGRTYLFCVHTFYRQLFCIPRFSLGNLKKRIKRSKVFKRKWKPKHFARDTKRLERNRKNGYEKRIHTNSHDDDYVIFEIYYANVGRGNKLEPLTN